MSEVVRFAPSPTGEIHIGNVRTALFNAFRAREGGTFVLRFDDTDAQRSQERFAALIEADLAWLGIHPDRVARQSERLDTYDAVAGDLKSHGLLYPCYETPDELERKRALQRARGKPPVYDRAALALSAEDRRRLEGEGRRAHWRFRLPEGARSWNDLCRGPQTVDLSTVSDPILVREDGTFLYTLPSVVDDAAFGVTAVVRGEDHVTNTAVQIALFEAIGVSAPAFGHHNLLVRADGEPLSKRDNPLSVSRLRAAGYEPMAVASLAALVGTAEPVRAVGDLAALADAVALSSVSRGPATFDQADLDRLNAAIVHELPFEAVKDWLEEATGTAVDPRFWEIVRGNCAFRHDALYWHTVIFTPPDVGSVAEDRPVLQAARDALPPEPWDAETFRTWTDSIKAATGRKGRALFMPLRVALTGRRDGPEMGPLMGLIGRTAVAERLDTALAAASDGQT